MQEERTDPKDDCHPNGYNESEEGHKRYLQPPSTGIGEQVFQIDVSANEHRVHPVESTPPGYSWHPVGNRLKMCVDAEKHAGDLCRDAYPNTHFGNYLNSTTIHAAIVLAGVGWCFVRG